MQDARHGAVHLMRWAAEVTLKFPVVLPHPVFEDVLARHRISALYQGLLRLLLHLVVGVITGESHFVFS